MRENNISISNLFFMDSTSGNGYNQKVLLWPFQLNSISIFPPVFFQFLGSIVKAIETSSQTVSESDLNIGENAYHLLVLGIPNVGKSTVINRLRNVFLLKPGKAATVGPKAGVTRAVMERIKIADHPRKIYLFDTPGILEPSFHRFESDRDQESFLRCAACGNTPYRSQSGHTSI